MQVGYKVPKCSQKGGICSNVLSHYSIAIVCNYLAHININFKVLKCMFNYLLFKMHSNRYGQKEKEIFYLLVYPMYAYNSPGWAQQKQKPEIPFGTPTRLGTVHVRELSPVPPLCTSAGNWNINGAGIETRHFKMGYRPINCYLNPVPNSHQEQILWHSG